MTTYCLSTFLFNFYRSLTVFFFFFYISDSFILANVKTTAWQMGILPQYRAQFYSITGYWSHTWATGCYRIKGQNLLLPYYLLLWMLNEWLSALWFREIYTFNSCYSCHNCDKRILQFSLIKTLCVPFPDFKLIFVRYPLEMEVNVIFAISQPVEAQSQTYLKWWLLVLLTAVESCFYFRFYGI